MKNLRCLEDLHDCYCREEAETVSCEAGREVRLGEVLLVLCSALVEPQCESHKDACRQTHELLAQKRTAKEGEGKKEKRKGTWDDDVSEAEHRKLESLSKQVLWEHHLDRSIKGLCHRHHHLSSKDPEDVIKEQPREQDDASVEAVQVQELDGSQREGFSKHVIDDPVLREGIVKAEGSPANRQYNVRPVKLHLKMHWMKRKREKRKKRKKGQKVKKKESVSAVSEAQECI